MGIQDRDWNRDKHPATCSCVDCTKKRLTKKDDASLDLLERRFVDQIRRQVELQREISDRGLKQHKAGENSDNPPAADYP